MMRQIEIIVTPTGQSRIETKGFSGASCREASRFLEEALGQRTGERLSAEFYQTSNVGQQARQHE
jgi:hypothetical protein